MGRPGGGVSPPAKEGTSRRRGEHRQQRERMYEKRSAFVSCTRNRTKRTRGAERVRHPRGNDDDENGGVG